MRANLLRWFLPVLLVSAVFQLAAQQNEGDRKQFEETKAKAERGDAETQYDLGACYAKRGDLEKVKAVLKDNPALVLNKDGNGDTPLHWAASEVHKAVAKLLLANKSEVNAKDNVGRTPLHSAMLIYSSSP
jgi:ankyrin repeat protein